MDTHLDIRTCDKSGAGLRWPDADIASFGTKFVKAKHPFGNHHLFSDDALAALIDQYPRHLMQAFVMGIDPTRMDDNFPVDTTGISGADVVEAVKGGRLWFKLLRIQDWKGPYADIVDELYRHMSEKCPRLNSGSQGAILFFGSTSSQVYFHVDAKPNMLWHMRGKKRMWLYPYEAELVSPVDLEGVYTMRTDEDVPFDVTFDQHASVYDLEPGDVLSWPHNSPHRVVVTEGLSVSLGTLHETEESYHRSNVINANALLRQYLGCKNLSQAEQGVVPFAKSFLFRAARKLGVVGSVSHKAYETDYILDANSQRGVRKLESPVLTEFAKGPPA